MIKFPSINYICSQHWCTEVISWIFCNGIPWHSHWCTAKFIIFVRNSLNVLALLLWQGKNISITNLHILILSTVAMCGEILLKLQLNMLFVEKKIIRIITCSPYWAHTEPLLLASRIMTPSDITKYMTGISMYQWVHLNYSQYISKLFPYKHAFYSHDTRHANDLCIPNHKTKIRKCSMKVHGVQVWNDIPDDIKASSPIDMFKRKFRSFLIDRRLTILV